MAIIYFRDAEAGFVAGVGDYLFTSKHKLLEWGLRNCIHLIKQFHGFDRVISSYPVVERSERMKLFNGHRQSSFFWGWLKLTNSHVAQKIWVLPYRIKTA